MLQPKQFILFVSLAGLIALAPISNGLVFAEDEAKPAVESAKPAKPKAKKTDPFVVPDGTPAQLQRYIFRVSRLRLKSKNRSRLAAFSKKKANAYIEAADKILASPEATLNHQMLAVQAMTGGFVMLARSDGKKVVESMEGKIDTCIKAADKIIASSEAGKRQQQSAVLAKLRGLELLADSGDQKAAETIKQFPKQLVKQGFSELADLVEGMCLRREILKAFAGAPGAKSVDEMIETVKEKAAGKPNRTSLSLVRMVVTRIKTNRSVEKAVALCDEFADLYAKSEAKDAAKIVKQIQGIARRMQLMGNSMEIEGTLLSGEPLDWSDYKGKVVLVQFWSTGCHPCVAEIPNIKKNYDLYHDRGFEVVGISLDRNREKLEKFVEKNDLPWPTIYEEEQKNAGFQSPMAIHYDVFAIPTLILLDRDGKVVCERARGPRLGTELEKLLGPAEEPEQKEADGNKANDIE